MRYLARVLATKVGDGLVALDDAVKLLLQLFERTKALMPGIIAAHMKHLGNQYA